MRPSWWACVGRREGRNVLRPWRGGAGRLRVLRPVNTEYVIVFKVGVRRPGGSAARFHFGTLRREIPFIPQITAGT